MQGIAISAAHMGPTPEVTVADLVMAPPGWDPKSSAIEKGPRRDLVCLCGSAGAPTRRRAADTTEWSSTMPMMVD